MHSLPVSLLTSYCHRDFVLLEQNSIPYILISYQITRISRCRKGTTEGLRDGKKDRRIDPPHEANPGMSLPVQKLITNSGPYRPWEARITHASDRQKKRPKGRNGAYTILPKHLTRQLMELQQKHHYYCSKYSHKVTISQGPHRRVRDTTHPPARLADTSEAGSQRQWLVTEPLRMTELDTEARGKKPETAACNRAGRNWEGWKYCR